MRAAPNGPTPAPARSRRSRCIPFTAQSQSAEGRMWTPPHAAQAPPSASDPTRVKAGAKMTRETAPGIARNAPFPMRSQAQKAKLPPISPSDLEELATVGDELLLAQGLEEVDADAVEDAQLLGLGVHPGRRAGLAAFPDRWRFRRRPLGPGRSRLAPIGKRGHADRDRESDREESARASVVPGHLHPVSGCSRLESTRSIESRSGPPPRSRRAPAVDADRPGPLRSAFKSRR